ncbi:P-loop containing nucleoside triphosphate hydrolase protein [Aspergillus californicus]
MLRPPALRARVLRPCSFRPPSRAVSSLPPLIRIQNGTFYENYPTAEDEAKGQNPPLFSNLNFLLPSDPNTSSLQRWAVIGSEGRTQLLNVFRGQYVAIPPTARSYPYLLTPQIARKDRRLRHPSNAIKYIGFSGEGSGAIGGTRGAYLSARYESLREETDWTVQQYLKGQTSLNPLEKDKDGNVRDEKLYNKVITDLRLRELLDMPVANLSNGQTRRARIAKALLGEPELVLLDDPFMGLDPATVSGISELLYNLATRSKPRLVLSLRPQDTIPEWITHVLVLGKSNEILLQNTREHVQKAFQVWGKLAGFSQERVQEKERSLYLKAEEDMAAGRLDKQLIWDLQSVPPTKGAVELPPIQDGEPLIEMNGVRVQYGDKVVLGDWSQLIRREEQDGLHWTVRRGQRWAILGPNGSGKTTLISLITSDHPQAYALPIKIFGHSRLPEPGKPGISIFEIQSRIGHSSPEIHAFFPRQLTIRQAVESAFAETFLSKPHLNHERDLDVSAALRFFKAELDPNFTEAQAQGPPHIYLDKEIFPKQPRQNARPFYPPDFDVEYADTTTFAQLSVPQQRIILFLRAVVHKPDLIILDEPFSGMPSSMRDKCQIFLEFGEVLHPGGTSKDMHKRITTLPWLRGYHHKEFGYKRNPIRHTGLSDSQALIIISHLREEIPNIVRHYMRLPLNDVSGDDGLDFRFGVLKHYTYFSNPETWNLAWQPAPRFQKSARRTFRKSFKRKENADGEPMEFDEEVFEYWTI